MFTLSGMLLNFGFLPVQLVREWRTPGTRLQKFYLIARFVVLFIAITSFLFKINHWPGAGILYLLSNILIPFLIFLFFYMRIRGQGALPFRMIDLLVAVLIYVVHIYLTRATVTPEVVVGYVHMVEKNLEINSGLRSSNELIYNSLDSLALKKQLPLEEAARETKRASDELVELIDSMRYGFIESFIGPIRAEDFHLGRVVPSRLAVTHDTYNYFIGEGHGRMLKRSIEHYHEQISRVTHTYHLPLNPVNKLLDTSPTVNPWGDTITWEERNFMRMALAATIAQLTRIEQAVLLNEGIILNGLVHQLDAPGELRLVQEKAALESERMMELKRSEITRIQQQQELQQLQLEKSQTELRQQRTVTLFAFTGIGFVLVLLSISTRAWYLKQQDNKKLSLQTSEITSQKDEIEAQRDEIEAQRNLVSIQKEQIEKVHGELTASIDYATRLQEAILPETELLDKYLSGHMVFFRPKHRVSGDFYWWGEADGQLVITATDCTGHGVPGAIMSMMGVSLLREIVIKEGITDPGEILNHLRDEVIRSLYQRGASHEQKDGMDLSLITIDTSTLRCRYAGANSPLYHIRDGELTIFRPQMMPVSHYQQMDPFTTQQVPLRKGDQLYLFSDGYADQFGGEKRKKFKYGAFRKLLADHSGLPMAEQLEVLERTITDWQGTHEQIDDMVIVGIRI